MNTNRIENLAHWSYWAVVGLYAILIGYTVLNKLPCDTDEAAILNPAVLVAEGQPMAIPCAGPGAGHDSGFWYQLPLHPYLLGLWMRVFGISLLSATLFSYLLGLSALLALYLYRKRFGTVFIAAAASFLLADAVFPSRMSIVRYDGISVILSFIAIWLLQGRDGIQLDVKHWFLAGLCLGLSALNNFLFVLYIPALCAAATLLHIWKQPKSLFVNGLSMGAGVLLGLLPAVIYAFRASEAFEGQFVYHLFELSDKSEGFIAQEIQKYWNYYARWPLVLLLSLFSLFYLALEAYRSRSQLLAGYLLIALFMWGLVTFASGGKSWHHFVVIPALSLAVGAAVQHAYSSLSKEKISIFSMHAWPHKLLLLLFPIAALNGFALGPLRLALEAKLEQGTRHYGEIGQAVEAYIPEGAKVFGTRRLFFTGHSNNWDFVADYYTRLQTAEDLGANNEFEWLVLERGKEERIQADLENAYVLVSSYTQESAAIDQIVGEFPFTDNYFIYRAPRTFDIYQRKGSNE
jgi:hypothetical protein